MRFWRLWTNNISDQIYLFNLWLNALEDDIKNGPKLLKTVGQPLWLWCRETSSIRVAFTKLKNNKKQSPSPQKNYNDDKNKKQFNPTKPYGHQPEPGRGKAPGRPRPWQRPTLPGDRCTESAARPARGTAVVVPSVNTSQHNTGFMKWNKKQRNKRNYTSLLKKKKKTKAEHTIPQRNKQ